MRKFLSLFLAAILLLSLTACQKTDAPNGSDAAADGQFRVGFSKVDITPYEESVPLAGYGNTSTRMHDGIADRLYTTCIAVSDAADNTVLFFTNDLTSAAAVCEDIRDAISEATGVPREQIFFAATHTHSAPDLGNTNEATIIRYRTRLEEWAVTAAKNALADRAPATLEIASVVTENLNFVRHYYVSDGGVVGENFGLLHDRTYVSHCHDADGQLQLVRFDRGEKKPIVLANWQVHPTRYGNTTNASADFISPMRTRMEEKLDCHFAYFSGASGNLNPGSRITSEMRTQDYTVMGQLLADYAIEALKAPTAVNSGKVQAITQTVTTEVDKSESHKLSDAVVVRDMWITTNNLNDSMAEAEKYGFNSQWHASGVISRASLGDTVSMEIAAVSFGDVAFVSAPYEMFDQNGVQIKEGSPFDMTLVFTLSNGGIGYVASEECATHGCYGFDSRRYGTLGSAEELVADYLDILSQLYATK